LAKLDASYEIILVDDRTRDGSRPEIERLVELDESVRGILLSRNFGQHAAITAGLQHAKGDWVVVMDCDLQDPPEDIPRLYAKALEGHDIVLGRRAQKPTGRLRRLLGGLDFRGVRVFGGARLGGQYGGFSIASRKVVEAFLTFPRTRPSLHDDSCLAEL
jgi:dolichol-phosphate mannosyltransferase